MSTRCRHQHVVLTESADEVIEHTFLNGQYKVSNHNPGNPHLAVEVHCEDCGFQRRYPNYLRGPNWIRALMEAVGQ